MMKCRIVKFWVPFLFLAVHVSGCRLKNNSTNNDLKVVGGNSIAQYRKFFAPTVMLTKLVQQNYSQVCTGFMIDSHTVVTALHCVAKEISDNTLDEMKVLVGTEYVQIDGVKFYSNSVAEKMATLVKLLNLRNNWTSNLPDSELKNIKRQIDLLWPLVDRYDIAILILKDPVVLDSYYSIDTHTSPSDEGNSVMFAGIGSPSKVGRVSDIGDMHYGFGTILAFARDHFLSVAKPEIDNDPKQENAASEGDSGGPVFKCASKVQRDLLIFETCSPKPAVVAIVASGKAMLNSSMNTNYFLTLSLFSTLTLRPPLRTITKATN